ncbi:hypothetical protein FB45DRAFT_1065576 [Roridomyces roridus]|uniref:Uncharacterized protein n=1 Tax=Roridomyces roridus TaxID=1738132 RepID=A0AAD7FCN4_9AGAR|nr:hypothetical protein FB45DRAFT_1065576 [Roridomyces roridus]
MSWTDFPLDVFLELTKELDLQDTLHLAAVIGQSPRSLGPIQSTPSDDPQAQQLVVPTISSASLQRASTMTHHNVRRPTYGVFNVTLHGTPNGADRRPT